MANKRKFTFLKSNYTLRTKHKSLNKKNTDIYVRDYMVTTNNGGWESATIPYGESNFKMVHRFDEKQSRKHSYGKWITNKTGDVWTLEEIKNALSKYDTSIDRNKKMVMDTSYTSLLDFAYFGSCSELIRYALVDIIKKFPGELYVTNRKYSYYDETEDDIFYLYYNTLTNEIQKETNGNIEDGDIVPLYYIDNPFGIDIFTQSIEPNTSDAIKYFCVSRSSYKILNAREEICDNIDFQRWIFEKPEKEVDFGCLRNGQYIGKTLIYGMYENNTITYQNNNSEEPTPFIIYIYYQDGKFVYLTHKEWCEYHVRLSNEKIDEFYEKELDDFERFLLNRETKPRFLIEIDTLEETNSGFEYGKMTLNWPTVGNWNLDVNSSLYDTYVEKLLTQAQIYDEYFSNNLWRMMTHDSIKNMDLTFTNEKLDEDETDYNIGTTRIEGLFWAYGRLFDDLKRYIDNLKCINTISYNKHNNIAENALREKCELNGWEIYDPTQFLDPNTEVEQLYPNQFKTYNLTDVKERFLTELLMNSKNIFAKKGTKGGIETLMSLFGFCSYDYGKSLYPYLSPNEQIYDENKRTIKTWEDLDDGEKQHFYDYRLNEYVAVAKNTSDDVISVSEELPCEQYNALKIDFIHPDEFNMETDPFAGLPVREVVFSVVENNETIYKKYIIPWYDKAQYKDNKMYFQMYGGWGKLSLKEISEKIQIDSQNQGEFSEIRSTKTFNIYSETIKYIKTKDTVNDMLRTDYSDLNNGDVYYINTIYGDECHYYILTDKEKSTSLEGWKPVSVEDFEQQKDNALKVLYLESIIDDYRGNNPHVGYGNYDEGNEYLEYFRHLFKYEIDNITPDNPIFREEAYDCNDGEVLTTIKDCGFLVQDFIMDNMKTWYFTPSNFSYMDVLENNNGIYTISTGTGSTNQIVNVGKTATGMTFESNLSAYNLETQEGDSNDEAAANSIINVKNFKILFANKYSKSNDFKKYLYGVILPYITQLIPSTTISSVEFEGVESSASVKYNFADVAGIVQ